LAELLCLRLIGSSCHDMASPGPDYVDL